MEELNFILLLLLTVAGFFLVQLVQERKRLYERRDELRDIKSGLEDEVANLDDKLQESERKLNSFGILEDIKDQIHREDGPAIYLKGDKVVYFWNGMWVPEHVVIDPESITPEEVINAENVEYRRVLLERMGIGNFITKIGGEREQKDPYGILWRVGRLNAENALFSHNQLNNRDREILDRIFGDASMTKFVQVKDASTSRQYFLQIPSTIQTAKEAVAWTFKVKEEEYNPQEQT